LTFRVSRTESERPLLNAFHCNDMAGLSARADWIVLL